MDPRVRILIHTKMSWIRNTDKMFNILDIILNFPEECICIVEIDTDPDRQALDADLGPLKLCRLFMSLFGHDDLALTALSR